MFCIFAGGKENAPVESTFWLVDSYLSRPPNCKAPREQSVRVYCRIRTRLPCTLPVSTRQSQNAEGGANNWHEVGGIGRAAIYSPGLILQFTAPTPQFGRMTCPFDGQSSPTRLNLRSSLTSVFFPRLGAQPAQHCTPYCAVMEAKRCPRWPFRPVSYTNRHPADPAFAVHGHPRTPQPGFKSCAFPWSS